MDANYRRWKRHDLEFKVNAVELLESTGRSIADNDNRPRFFDPLVRRLILLRSADKVA